VGEYVFDDNQADQELRRLRRIEGALDAQSQALIARTGLASGGHCLEVGAGGGSILSWLGERVGTGGRAVGIDKNTAHLKSFQDAPFEVIEADVRELCRPASFDLIHARYVLIHNCDADGILVHLRELLKPGGQLVLEEPDFEAAEWIDDNYKAAGDRVNRAICAMFNGLSLDSGFGKRLPMLMSTNGFSVRHIEDRAHLEPGGGPVALMMADSAGALREKYLATGEVAPEDIDQYIRGARDPASWAVYYSTVGIVAGATQLVRSSTLPTRSANVAAH
jgi:SAM-dependent methyltransferase